MKVHTGIGGSSTATLSTAILIYSTKTSSHAGYGSSDQHPVCTVHDVVDGKIQEGVLATESAIRSLAVRLVSHLQTKLELADPNILAVSMDAMLWHCPPTKRQMWFQPSREGGEELKKVSGEKFPQPHLVFFATQNSFRVFAIRTNGKRPTANTRLYKAPYWNVSNAGFLCVGNTPFPKELSPSRIPQFEAAFYKSSFTHPHGDLHMTKTPQAKLWPSLKNRRKFPEEELIPIRGLTLGKLLTEFNKSQAENE